MTQGSPLVRFPAPGLHVASRPFNPYGAHRHGCLMTGAPKRHGSPPACTASTLIGFPRRTFGVFCATTFSPWEAAELCRNVFAAQEEQPDTPKRVKRA